MKFTSGFVVLAAALGAQAQMILNTPSGVTTCLNTLLTWTRGTGTPPFRLTVHQGADSASPAIETLATDLTGESYSWLVRYPAGTSIFLQLRDQPGLTVSTSPFIVGAGTSTDCLTSGGPSPSAPGTTPSGSAPSGSSPTTAKPSASASTTPSAGEKISFNIVGAGALALGVAALGL